MIKIHYFDPREIRIPINVEMVGPLTIGRFTFSLDTGSTRSSIRPSCLARIGYDLSKPKGHVNVRGVTGVGSANLFSATSITALGHTAKNLNVIAQDYPKSVTVDGLLGLDFFREKILTIDFRRGTISLRPPYASWQFWR